MIIMHGWGLIAIYTQTLLGSEIELNTVAYIATYS